MNIYQLVRTNILEMESYSSARSEYTGAASIFLDANENPVGPLNRYPDPGQKELKQAISSWKKTAAENIFIGNGSDELIDLCIRIFCTPGKDAVLSFTPSYGMYKVAANLNDVSYYGVPLDDQFQIDQKALQPYLSMPDLKIIFICSPNNPTGNTIEGIEQILRTFKGIVIVDEAYIDFASTQSKMSQITQYPNLIVIQTLSKACGLAAARIGIAYSNPDIIGLLHKVKPPYNISSLNQDAALRAIKDQAFLQQSIQCILTERDRLSAALSSLSFIEEVFPSEANFILIRVPDANRLYSYLQARSIIIRNRDKELKGCLRISIGTHEENSTLLTALSEYELQ
jgi:histidinol-phosphate aminotransferase